MATGIKSNPGHRQKPPGRPMQATLYDVCSRSGVSSATVSRVFSGSARVSNETRERVLSAARELSYLPSHAARALAAHRTNTLGVIFPAIASGFYAEVLAGIDEMAAENGFDVMAAFSGGQQRSRTDLVQRWVHQNRVDAVLLMNLERSAQLPAECVGQVPIVVIDRRIDGMDLQTIGIDNVGGTQAMIEHLYEQGHRRIAVLAGPAGTHDAEQRLAGCRQAMAGCGLPLEDRWVLAGGFTLESGARAASELLSSGELPDAIFCLNDAMAFGALNEFRRAGLSVPEDVALGGFDDVEAAEHLGLTSVACPMRLMGQLAARAAINAIAAPDQPAADQCLQVRLVVRRSSLSKRKVAGRMAV